MSCAARCVELGCGLTLALETLLEQQVELKIAWGLQVEVGQAEPQEQEEQVEVKMQVQQETTQRRLGLWPVLHCWARLGEFVQSEALVLFPSLAAWFLFWWLSPGRSWVYGLRQTVKQLQRRGQPPQQLVDVPSFVG